MAAIVPSRRAPRPNSAFARTWGWVPTWGTRPRPSPGRCVPWTACPVADSSGVSRLYATRPVGVLDQPDFHNAVVALDVLTTGDPEGRALNLLIALKALERSFGRQQRARWGPRELDLDLLIFGRHRFRQQRPEGGRSSDPARTGVQWLEVPHPAASERTFVLAPLADLVPGLVPPGWSMEVSTALRAARVAEGLDAVRAVATWDAGTATWGA